MVEKVHLKFCKLLLNLKTSTANCLVYGELGRFPLSVNIKQRMVSYWTKLISGKQTKLCSITYRLMFHLFSVQNVNFQWLTYVKGIFDECGLTYIWNSQNFINERYGLRKILNNAYATSSNKIGMMTFNSVQKPLIIEFSKILLDLKIILTY
jgi:hypothetical protein